LVRCVFEFAGEAIIKHHIANQGFQSYGFYFNRFHY